MADRKIVQCISSFHANIQGVPTVVGVGDLYFADDPVVKGREQLFSNVTVKSSGGSHKTAVSGSSVEEATSSPGSRRRMTRPKDAQKSEGENKPKDDEV